MDGLDRDMVDRSALGRFFILQHEAKKLFPYFIIVTVSTYVLMVLGSLVRATDSGLACPDWPLCYGQIIPSFDFHIFVEWFHRLFAGTYSVLVIFLTFKVLRTEHLKSFLAKTFYLVLFLLAWQVILGGLTVLKLLDPKIVAGHLVNAMLLFAVLCWMSYQVYQYQFLDDSTPSPSIIPSTIKFTFFTLFFLIFTQMVLGGMVSSNGAGTACPDFPLCHGMFWPAATFHVTLQMLHRYVAFILLGFVFFILPFFAKANLPFWSKKTSQYLGWLLAGQVILGVINVYGSLPDWASVLHLANGLLMFGLTAMANIELNYNVNLFVEKNPTTSNELNWNKL